MGSEKTFKCVELRFDIIPVDEEDIKYGAPSHDGYTFTVKKEDALKRLKFIIKTLKELNIPIQGIYLKKVLNLTKDKIDSKNKIMTKLLGDAEYFIERSKERGK